MAAITWAHVEDHAAQMSGVDADAQTDILSHVNTTLSVDFFGGETAAKLKLARVYLAAHFGQMLLTANATSGASGSVTSKSLGDMSVGFGSSSTSSILSSSEYGTTSYGQLYLTLVRRTTARVGFIT